MLWCENTVDPWSQMRRITWGNGECGLGQCIAKTIESLEAGYLGLCLALRSGIGRKEPGEHF